MREGGLGCPVGGCASAPLLCGLFGSEQGIASELRLFRLLEVPSGMTGQQLKGRGRGGAQRRRRSDRRGGVGGVEGSG